MIDRPLLALLADGAFHSGQSLGVELGMSRAAVCKHVAMLRASGIDVHSVPGKGYRLVRALDLLDAQKIHSGMTPLARRGMKVVEVLSVAGSTNEVAMARIRRGDRRPMAIFAEQQTAGRGRRGRPWESPFGANIYLSVAWEFPGGLATIDGLSLAVGVALCEAFEEVRMPGIGLKWPNDLVRDRKKLGGILIEVSGEATGSCSVVIGVGVNVSMSTVRGVNIDQPWTDLRAAGYAGSRNELAAIVLDHLIRMLQEFSETGFSAFAQRWRRFDVVLGRRVDVLVGDARVAGIAAGIDEGGALLVDTDAGVRRFFGGEVSVREG